jgi:SAM-dependent methyltransferase
MVLSVPRLCGEIRSQQNHPMTVALACTLCGSLKTRAVLSFTTAALIQKWKEIWGIDIESEFSGLSEFELRQCEECAIRFFSPESLCGSSRIYASLDRFDWYYVPHKWEHIQALQDISACKSGLEIGCGFGDFIQLAKKTKGIQITGLEQNPSAIQEGQRRGITMYSASLHDYRVRMAVKHDAIFCFQVLEHVPSPGEFLNLCCELLSTKGRLILGLPNADSFLKFQFNLLDLPPHHMSRWPVDTLKFLPKLFPLRPLRIECEPLPEHQIDGYVEAYCDRFARSINPYANHPFLKSRLGRILRRTGLRKLLKGMTIYAAFERL